MVISAIFIIILKCSLKIIFYTTLCLIAAIFGLKLWLQPNKRSYKSNIKLNGKVALITGGNSGIGLEIARDLARRGATVVIASRNEGKSDAAVRDIITNTGNQHVYHKHLDLVKFSSIRKFAAEFNRTFDRLDILVNNAGCAGIKPTLSEDGIQKIIQINYVGPFMLTNLLLDKLVASKPSRIVIVSSYANEFHNFDPDDVAGVKDKASGFDGTFRTYANSKLCNILWAKALAKRLPDGVTVNALHPGVVLTDIFRHTPEVWRKVITWMISAFFKTAEEGAQTGIYLCVDPEVEGITGEYFDECEIAKADKLTRDDGVVEKVWENTMLLVEGK